MHHNSTNKSRKIDIVHADQSAGFQCHIIRAKGRWLGVSDGLFYVFRPFQLVPSIYFFGEFIVYFDTKAYSK